MLVIIGGNRSSCVYPGTHVLDKSVKPTVLGCVLECIKVVDFGREERIVEFLESLEVRHPANASDVLIVEHVWLTLGVRVTVLKKVYQDAINFLLAHRQYGYTDVILLTRRVELIRKVLRDAADVAFDFSA